MFNMGINEFVYSSFQSLMSELDRREIQFSAVQDRGESLLLQNHPASKCIESYMSSMNSQWSWILQLTLCLETHLKHAAYYQQFYKDVKEAENWLNKYATRFYRHWVCLFVII